MKLVSSLMQSCLIIFSQPYIAAHVSWVPRSHLSFPSSFISIFLPLASFSYLTNSSAPLPYPPVLPDAYSSAGVNEHWCHWEQCQLKTWLTTLVWNAETQSFTPASPHCKHFAPALDVRAWRSPSLPPHAVSVWTISQGSHLMERVKALGQNRPAIPTRITLCCCKAATTKQLFRLLSCSVKTATSGKSSL